MEALAVEIDISPVALPDNSADIPDTGLVKVCDPDFFHEVGAYLPVLSFRQVGVFRPCPSFEPYLAGEDRSRSLGGFYAETVYTLDLNGPVHWIFSVFQDYPCGSGHSVRRLHRMAESFKRLGNRSGIGVIPVGRDIDGFIAAAC